MDTPYYFGGYFLLKPKPINFGFDKGTITQTTSACINQSLVDTWVFSWASQSKKMLKQVKTDFQIDDATIAKIQAWADKKFELNKLQWVDNFADYETALEYKQTFFSHLKDLHIYSIYLSASNSKELIDEFDNDQDNQGEFGLRQNLLRQIEEDDTNNEKFLGYDLIGVELDGGYHSFYCNNSTKELLNKFDLNINQNGLIDYIKEPFALKAYLNDETNGFEPVPWYIAKTKMVTE